MTTVAVCEANGAGIDYDRVARLLAKSYPAGSAVMDAAFLQWSLEGWAAAAGEGMVVTADRGGDLVGFAGASARAFDIDGAEFTGFIVSFVAVAPVARGVGLAQLMYRALLDRLSDLGESMVLTFAHADSAGASLIEYCYKRAGWSGCELEAMSPWGVLRRRLADLGPELPAPVSLSRSLRISESPAAKNCLGRDPRVVSTTDRGIRVSQLRILGSPDPVGIIDSIPFALDAWKLAAAIQLASRSLSPDISRLVLPYLPGPAAAIGAACGLRRMPGPVYRAWTWTTSPQHPALTAARCLAPIT